MLPCLHFMIPLFYFLFKAAKQNVWCEVKTQVNQQAERCPAGQRSGSQKAAVPESIETVYPIVHLLFSLLEIEIKA